MEITFIHSGMAEVAAIMPDVELIGPNRVRYQAKDIVRAYKARTAMTILANQVL